MEPFIQHEITLSYRTILDAPIQQMVTETIVKGIDITIDEKMRKITLRDERNGLLIEIEFSPQGETYIIGRYRLIYGANLYTFTYNDELQIGVIIREFAQ